MPRHGKSLRDALQEALKANGQATIYYNGEDGTHAVYDVLQEDAGMMYLNGRIIMADDLPADLRLPTDKPGVYIYAQTIRTAEVIFGHHQVDIQAGWKTRP